MQLVYVPYNAEIADNAFPINAKAIKKTDIPIVMTKKFAEKIIM